LSKADIIVVSAPSGAGKTTLIRRLLPEAHGLHFSVSHTTRQPRAGERAGIDYHFTGRAEFDAMAASGAFLEWAEIHGNRYGTSLVEVDGALARGEDVLLDVDSQGARIVRRLRPGAILIFILPPGVEVLRERLASRGEGAPDEMRSRLEGAGREVASLDIYDYCVVNDTLESALADMLAILRARRLQRDRMPDSVREIVRGFEAAVDTPRRQRSAN